MARTLRTSAVTRLLKQQASLAHFGSYVFREPALGNILTEAARVCAESLDVPFCKISRFRKENNDFIVEAGYGWNTGVVGQVVTKCDLTTPHGQAFITGKPIILKDLTKKPKLLLPDYYKSHGIVSIIDVIIRNKNGEPYGVLEIDSPIFHIYNKHDIHFLTGFANVLAEAVATANHNQAMCNSMKQMQTLVEQMKALVAEKDQALDDRAVMAEELKHRVRNNLQLIHGMLTMHLSLLSNLRERDSAFSIMRRVMSLAQVYEQLLGTGMSRVIEFGGYLTALCTNLPSFQQTETSDVTLTCDVVPVLVDLDTATALGMAIAELISNSYKHAFGSSGGSIQVKLRAEGTIAISDNGKGFVEQPGSKRHGVGLVRRLVEQVQGKIEMQPGDGTTWRLKFLAVPFARDAAS